MGVSLARLGEIIVVGTLLLLVSHKSAVGAGLSSLHTLLRVCVGPLDAGARCSHGASCKRKASIPAT